MQTAGGRHDDLSDSLLDLVKKGWSSRRGLLLRGQQAGAALDARAQRREARGRVTPLQFRIKSESLRTHADKLRRVGGHFRGIERVAAAGSRRRGERQGFAQVITVGGHCWPRTSRSSRRHRHGPGPTTCCSRRWVCTSMTVRCTHGARSGRSSGAVRLRHSRIHAPTARPARRRSDGSTGSSATSSSWDRSTRPARASRGHRGQVSPHRTLTSELVIERVWSGKESPMSRVGCPLPPPVDTPGHAGGPILP